MKNSKKICKKCSSCKNNFTSYYKENRKFCSKQCYYNSLKKNNNFLNCLTCNKKFKYKTNKKFCSLSCFNKNKINNTFIKCKNCHIKILKKDKYCKSMCSEKCLQNYTRKINNKKIIKISKKCICNKTFSYIPSKNRKFCSRQCFGLSVSRNLIEDFTIINKYNSYWLGFIFGDGSINKNGLVTIGLANNKNNIKLLKDFSNVLYGKNNIWFYNDKIILTFKPKNSINFFKKFGIIPNKTYDQHLIMPTKYKNDFIRGYFDADGWASYGYYKNKNNNLYFKSCVGICSYLKNNLNIINNFLGYGNINKKSNQELYEWRISNKKDLIHFFYKINGYPRLERKWKNFEKIIEYHEK